MTNTGYEKMKQELKQLKTKDRYQVAKEIEVARAHGWSMGRMMGAGFGIIARRYRIEYVRPAFLEDELEVSTWVSDPRRATADRHYTINRASDGDLLARAHVLWVWVSLESGRPMRIPPNFLDAFEDNIVR